MEQDAHPRRKAVQVAGVEKPLVRRQVRWFACEVGGFGIGGFEGVRSGLERRACRHRLFFDAFKVALEFCRRFDDGLDLGWRGGRFRRIGGLWGFLDEFRLFHDSARQIRRREGNGSAARFAKFPRPNRRDFTKSGAWSGLNFGVFDRKIWGFSPEKSGYFVGYPASPLFPAT